MLEELETAIEEVVKHSNHKGYWYKLEDVLIAMVCGLLCSFETIKDIYMWSRASHIQEFFRYKFSIQKLPKKFHFYNMLSYVNYKQFNKEFEAWILKTFQGDLSGKTTTLDGKSIRSIAKLC